MITYVDTSSLLTLLIDEQGSDQVEHVWEAADVLAASALIVVEARAALAAAERGARITTAQHRATKRGLAGLVEDLTLVAVTDALIVDAAELAQAESLRGYDAVHLASALTVQADVLTSADLALCEAANRQGLHVANPLER